MFRDACSSTSKWQILFPAVIRVHCACITCHKENTYLESLFKSESHSNCCQLKGLWICSASTENENDNVDLSFTRWMNWRSNALNFSGDFICTSAVSSPTSKEACHQTISKGVVVDGCSWILAAAAFGVYLQMPSQFTWPHLVFTICSSVYA